jgi:hypothetical protein
MNNFNYHGIIIADISTWQDSPMIAGTVDFKKMRAFGFRAVCLRASNGITQDADFETYRKNATGVIPWFAYHYYNNLYDPRLQAQKFFNILAPNIPPVCVLDLEDKQSGFRGWRHWYDFLVEFQRLSGLPNNRIWIYTNETYFAETSGAITTAQRNWFARFLLWLASYFADPQHPNLAYVDIPQPWTDIILLQSGTPPFGLQAGVESIEIDYNQFSGDEELFTMIFGAEPTQPETGETMSYFKVTPTVLNIRSSPAFIADPSNDIGDLLKDDIVDADALPVGGFRRLRAVWRNNVPVALPASPTGECWASSSYLTATVFTPPVVTALPDVLFIGVTRDDVKEYRKAA